jgi:hypothetical protein
MMTHPDLMRDLAKQHQNDMIVDAEHQRLLNAARRRRRPKPQRRDQ